RPEKILEDPLPAYHRRGTVRVGRDGQDAAVAEQPSSRIVFRQLDAAEVRAFDTLDTVVPRDPIVQERVVGIEQLESAPILSNDTAEEQLRLPPQALTQRIVEIREDALHRHDGVEIAQ